MDGKPVPPPPMFIPSPTTPQWVPFPGTKRKAESDSYGEYGPPPKICAIDVDIENSKVMSDDQYAMKEEVVPSNSRDCSGGSPLRPFLVQDGDEDEEMKDPNFEETSQQESPTSPTSSRTDFNYAGAPFSTDNGNGNGGKRPGGDGNYDGRGMLGSGGNQHEHDLDDDDCGESKFNADSNNFPKMYFFEGLREVLSSKPSADVMLEQVLRKEASKNNSTSRTTALVLWKDPAQITPKYLNSSSSCEAEKAEEKGLLPCVTRGQDNQDKQKSETCIQKECEDDEDKMDIILS